MRRSGRLLAALPALGFGCLAYLYLTLPDVRPLRTSNPTSTAFMELRAREAREQGRAPAAPAIRWVRYDRISPHLTRAVLTAEDDAFWQHDGIDLAQIRESLAINLDEGRVARGASTITQQLAKNLYLSPARTPWRKLRELYIARRLEAELSKRRILEIYLNVIEWGDGIYGADAAARTYFGHSAASVDPPQAALLAGAIVNPRRLDPARPSERLRSRQRIILRRMGYTPPRDVLQSTGFAPTPDPADEAAPDDAAASPLPSRAHAPAPPP